MKTAIYGYRTELKNGRYDEGHVIFRKRVFQSWSDALDNSLALLTQEFQFAKRPIVTWFQKL